MYALIGCISHNELSVCGHESFKIEKLVVAHEIMRTVNCINSTGYIRWKAS